MTSKDPTGLDDQLVDTAALARRVNATVNEFQGAILEAAPDAKLKEIRSFLRRARAALDLAGQMIGEVRTLGFIENVPEYETDKLIIRLTSAIDKLRTWIGALGILIQESSPSDPLAQKEGIDGRVSGILEALREISETVFDTNYYDPKGDVDLRKGHFHESWMRNLDQFEILRDVEHTRDKAVEVLRETREAAGEVASGSLSAHFHTYGRNAVIAAEVLRAFATITLAGIVVYVVTTVPSLVSGGASISSIVARLSFTIPLGILVAYLARESSKHREDARWAYKNSIRLRTFDAFVAPLSDSQAAELRVEFGRQVFLSEDSGRQDSEGSTVVTETASLLASATELVKSAVEARRKS